MDLIIHRDVVDLHSWHILHTPYSEKKSWEIQKKAMGEAGISFLERCINTISMNAQRKLRYKEKMSHLMEFSQNLERWVQDYSSETDADDHTKTRFAMYHMGQLCVEAMTDVAAMMVKDFKQIPKDDYSNFKKLSELKLIPDDLERKLSEANGLRNRLAHDYNGVDETIALESINQLMETVAHFRDVVIKWLQHL